MRKPLPRDGDGNICIQISEEGSEKISHLLREMNDRAKCERARGASRVPYLRALRKSQRSLLISILDGYPGAVICEILQILDRHSPKLQRKS